MTNDFDPHWPHGHVTRDGRKARIICADARFSSERSVIALVRDGENEALYNFWKDGTTDDLSIRLQNAPAPKRKVRVHFWMNVYSEGSRPYQALYHTREDALKSVVEMDRHIAVIEIDREVEEGEGL